MALLFDGAIPYLDFFFEHLPVAIVPMALPWILGGAFDPLVYTVLFGALMAACLWTAANEVEQVAELYGATNAGSSWLAIASPLFPIVLFRYDPVPLLLTCMALTAFMDNRRESGIWWASGGVLTKGWPIVFAITEWWRGKRGHALGLGSVAVVIFGMFLALPGFAEARSFTGIHSETFLGGLFTVVRIRAGLSLRTIADPAATYVAVPTWAVVLNIAIGLAILGLALFRSRGEFSWPKGVRLLAAAAVAMLIGSPLLSPQFILWPTPFLALHPSLAVRRLAIAVSSLTLLYMLGWNPGFQGDLWWVGVMNLRNLALLFLGFVCALSIPWANPAGARAVSA